MKIALIGQQCAGKTTVAEMIGYPIQKFAQPLYAINAILNVGKNRAFMQECSDLVKKHFGEKKFVDLFDPLKYRNAATDDCRFLPEVQLLKAYGWKLLYIQSDTDIRKARAESLGLDFIENHSSEQTEKLIPLCDKVIYNNSTIEALQEQVNDWI